MGSVSNFYAYEGKMAYHARCKFEVGWREFQNIDGNDRIHTVTRAWRTVLIFRLTAEKISY